MNFVKQVEEHLRDISTSSITASRSKRSSSSSNVLPGLKESSERAILTLRSLQTQYVSAVRRASSEGSPHPKTNIFTSQDILRPFLLAANYPQVNYKTLDLAFEGMRVLAEGDAINWKEDSVNIVRVLGIQCNVCLHNLSDEHHNGGGIGGTIKDNAGMAVGVVSSIGSSIWTGLGIGNMMGGAGNAPSSQNKVSEDHRSNNEHNMNTRKPQIAHVSTRTLKEDESIAIRILQLINMIIDLNGFDLTEEVLSQCISICLIFHLNEDHDDKHTAGPKMSGTARVRFNSKDSSASGHINSTGPLGSSSKKVSNVANATLRQIISTVFDRAMSEPETDNADERKPILVIATEIFADLCDILKTDNFEERLIKEAHGDPGEWTFCKGSIGRAIVSQQHIVFPPMNDISFDLLDLILEHQVQFCTDDKDVLSAGLYSVLKERLCPVVANILTAAVETSEGSDQSFHDTSRLLRVFNLSAKIVKSYGKFKFLQDECRDVLNSIRRLIKFATEKIRDSHDFEDGFVFDTNEINKTDSDVKDQEENTYFLAITGSAVDLIYSLVVDKFDESMPLFCSKDDEDSDILLSRVFGSICDLAVVVSSCKEHILKVVTVAEESFSKSRNQMKKEGTFTIQKVQSNISKRLRESEPLNIGEIVWIAFNTVLFTWSQLSSEESSEEEIQYRRVLIDGCFASSLAVVQHFIRRFPASDCICKSSLSGYLCFAKCVLPVHDGNNFQRMVVLNSLCKLMLPPREDINPRVLERQHMYSISLLFEILNSNVDDLGTEWNIVADALAGLALFPFPQSSQGQIISSNLGKIGSLYFSNDALVDFINVVFSSLLTSSKSLQSTRRESGTKLIGDEFYGNVLQKLQKVATVNCKSFRELPYQLVLLTDVIIQNMDRLGLFGESTTRCLGLLASTSTDHGIKVFCLDILSFLVVSGLTRSAEITEPQTMAQINTTVLLRPLCQCIYTDNDSEAHHAELTDIGELGLTCLKQIVNDGYNLSSSWIEIIHTLSAVARSDTSHKDYFTCCTIAFGCLKLVVDDILNEISDKVNEEIEAIRMALLDCCSTFGSSTADINISLTAIGMLWTIADQGCSPSAVDYVLDKLAHLASDKRVEVRNCVVNTLFSCVVGLGQKFISMQWERVFKNAIFPILDQAVSNAEVYEDDSSDKESSQRFKVSLHHSRDTASKQWTTTRVLTLRGIERVLRQYFNTLLVSSNNRDGWFEKTWERILEHCSQGIRLMGGRDTLDLRLASTDLLSLCCQISSRRGFVAADARVGTNMEVVNGALKTVRPLESSSRVPKPAIGDILTEPKQVERRLKMFRTAYSYLVSFGSYLEDNQEAIQGEDNSIHIQVLTKFSNGLSDIYESCKEYELRAGNWEQSIENEFVHLLQIICLVTRGPPKAKFLSQAQKPCLDLMKTMVLESSSKALEALIIFAKEAFCGRTANDERGEIVETEAGKVLSEICANNHANVLVTRKLTGVTISVELSNNVQDANNTGIADAPGDHQISSVESGQAATLKKENEELKEINAELMKQFEKLRYEKERLEQQVAVLSEGSSYI